MSKLITRRSVMAAGAAGALHLALGVVEFDRGHRLPAKDAEGLRLEGGEPSRGDVEDKEGAKANSGGRGERGVGIEAKGAAGEQYPARGEGGVIGGVGDLVHALAAQRGHRGQAAERQLGVAEAASGVDTDAVDGGKGDPGDGGVAGLCGQLDEVVDGGVGQCTEDLVSIESLEPQGFTSRNFACFQCGDHLTP